MMRVTQSMLYKDSINGLQGNFQKMKSVQDQSLSGQRLNKLGDDPSSVFRDLVFSNDLEGVKSLRRTTALATERLGLGESHLNVVQEKMLDAQDLVLKLGNDTVNGTPQILTAAAREALAMFQDVMSNVNAELDGVPLFSGAKTWVPYNNENLETTPVRMRQTADPSGDLVDAAGVTASINGTPSEVPVSARVRYDAAANTYNINMNGQEQDPVTATGGAQTLDLGQGITLNVDAPPADGDAYYFEVVPSYQGGEDDRVVKVSDMHNLTGNITADEIVGGVGPDGRGVNLFEALSGLRGALLRADTDEVSARLAAVIEGRAQASDLQNITGIRTAQVEAANNTLNYDQATLEESKALNKEADLFEVMSQLQQTSEAMQIMTFSERQVLDTSLLDFIR